jgi:hypothetical protein
MGTLETLNDLEREFENVNRRYQRQKRVVRNASRCGNPEIELTAITHLNVLLGRLFRLRHAIERCETVYWINVFKNAENQHKPENDEFTPKDLTGEIVSLTGVR